MKPIGLAIAATLAVMTFAAPLAAFAADKSASYSKDQIAQGKKEVPAVIQAAGVPCTLTDAAFVGQGTAKDAAGKEVKQSVYEAACQEGLGYGLVAAVGAEPKAYDCLALVGNPSLACKLPENLDPKKGLQPVVALTGAECAISDARYLGSKPSGEAYYEVGCGAAPGFILETAKAKTPTIVGCDQVASTPMACKFTSQAQLDAANTAKASALLAKSGQTCQMTANRAIGQLQSGDYAYEVACQGDKGFVLEANAKGDFTHAINCANAGNACKLTDSTKAESAETGTYTRLANASGFSCQVGKYRFIGMDKNNAEVVELQCTNRPDGAIAMFPSDNKKATFMDCVQAGAIQQSCKLTDPSALYTKYTEALASKGKKTCKVSGAHGIGQTTDGTVFVETACSDGLPGWVIAMTPAGTVSDLLTCGQAKASGAACTLPGNAK